MAFSDTVATDFNDIRAADEVAEAIVYRRENGEEISTSAIVTFTDPRGSLYERGPEPILVEALSKTAISTVSLHGEQIYWDAKWYRVVDIDSEDGANWTLYCVPSE